MDVSAVRLAIYRTRDRTDHCALFLRGNSAGVLREGSLVRLRAPAADQRRHGAPAAGCTRQNVIYPFWPASGGAADCRAAIHEIIPKGLSMNKPRPIQNGKNASDLVDVVLS